MLFFLQAEPAQFPQSFLTGQVLLPPATLVVSTELASGYPCLSCMVGGRKTEGSTPDAV